MTFASNSGSGVLHSLIINTFGKEHANNSIYVNDDEAYPSAGPLLGFFGLISPHLPSLSSNHALSPCSNTAPVLDCNYSHVNSTFVPVPRVHLSLDHKISRGLSIVRR